MEDDVTPKTAAEVIARLKEEGPKDFDDLADALCAMRPGELGSLCAWPWRSLRQHVASVLALSGKTVDDLAAAVAAKLGAT